MTNKGTSHQHGLANVHDQRPKSKLRKRKNKERAKEKRERLRAEGKIL